MENLIQIKTKPDPAKLDAATSHKLVKGTATVYKDWQVALKSYESWFNFFSTLKDTSSPGSIIFGNAAGRKEFIFVTALGTAYLVVLKAVRSGRSMQDLTGKSPTVELMSQLQAEMACGFYSYKICKLVTRPMAMTMIKA